MPHQQAGSLIVTRWPLIISAVAFICSCQTSPKTEAPKANASSQPAATQPMGEVKSDAKIGTAKLDIEQVQAEVEAFADRYVIKIAQATDQAARTHPEFRDRLHAVKLAVANGAYTIASGPNPVASVLDLIVQATLVRNSVEKNLSKTLPEEAGQQMLDVFTRLQDQAWALGGRVLSQQELADLRVLIDTWIQENPNQVYVAGIRFADFARLRPKEGSSLPTSVFGLLRIDPFASLDPAAREIQEARLLAERVFYFAQRMPQLLTWQTEQLYFTLVDARESKQLLANLNDITKSTAALQKTVSSLPQAIRTQLEQSEGTISTLLNEVNTSLAKADETATTLRDVSGAVTEAGRAWEGTVHAVAELAQTLSPPKSPDEPPSDPVKVEDIIAAIHGAQATAVELHELLDELNSSAQRGTIQSGIAASTTELRQSMQSIIITATICGIVLVATIVGGALFYRAMSSRWPNVQHAER